jgi:hypothetical protein
MSKEFAKFDAEYKKISAQYKALMGTLGADASKRLQLANANVTEGKANLRDSLVTARKNGVTGSSFADFAKDKSFQEGMQLLNRAVNDLEARIKDIDDIGAKATTAVAAIDTLARNIDKDLASRKDTSESKKEIEKLQQTLVNDRKALAPLAKLGTDKVKPYQRNYSKDLQQTVAAIVKEAPQAQAQAKRDTEAPQKLQDRVLNTSMNKCIGLNKEVGNLCESAMKKAGAGDKSGMQADLKKALEQRKALTAIVTEYQSVIKDYKAVVDDSKDKSKILAAVAKMAELDAAAERAVRGTMTTIKKAG